MTRVALVVMPFAAEDGPALGASLLRAALIREGFECDLLYLNLDFAAVLGLEKYRAIDSLSSLLIGEWLFASSVFDHGLPPADEFVRDVLKDDPVTSESLTELRKTAGEFIESSASRYEWARYDVVGFSSSFQQNMASIAMARRIRRIVPRIKIVMGGANCEGEMGLALLELFPELDAVASGESDESFPLLIREWEAKRDGTGVPGISVRISAGIHADIVPRPVQNLDTLPIPQFDDYFHQLTASRLSIRPGAAHLRMETSRGCWWGERAHCTFCGLNGGTMGYRRKSTGRILEEFDLLALYPTRSILMADNILDEKACEDLLPELSRRKSRMRLFFEIKSSVSRDQVRIMSEAGIWRLQPGIESLCSDTLGRMRKGTRGIDNVALMKWATEEDIALTWNWLCGFPGEVSEELSRMAELLPKLSHLQPPTGLFEVQVHRFAPFHTEPEKRGIGPIRPARAYRHIYPLPEAFIRKIAYFFERVESVALPSTAGALADAITSWRRAASLGREILVAVDDGNEILVRDTRACSRQMRSRQASISQACPAHACSDGATQRFKGIERALMHLCDSPRKPEEIARELNTTVERIDEAVSGLEARSLLIRLDERLLALPVFAPCDGADLEHELDVAAEVAGARAKDLFLRGSGGM